MTFESTRPVPQTMRTVERVTRGTPASDGAGVRLTRIIGKPGLPDLDPFLLLDEFRSDEASDYLAGFPDHPHRGFETVTYMLGGRMRHGDNRGNVGLLAARQRAVDDRRPRHRPLRNAGAGERLACGASSSGSTCRPRTR